MTGNTAKTTMRVANGTLYVLLTRLESAAATSRRRAGCSAPIYAGLQYSSGYDMLEKSFHRRGRHPQADDEVRQPRGAGNSVAHSPRPPPGTKSSFSSEVPLAVRANAPYAAFVQRGQNILHAVSGCRKWGVARRGQPGALRRVDHRAGLVRWNRGGRPLLDATGARLSSPPVLHPAVQRPDLRRQRLRAHCSGSCAPQLGLAPSTIPGPLPYAALGAGSTLHVGEQGHVLPAEVPPR